MVDKVLENRVRRMAERQGMRLKKSGRRDPSAIDFNGYMLVDAQTEEAIRGGKPHPFSESLGQISAFLVNQKDQRLAGPPTLVDMMADWFAERPERIAMCGLLSSEGVTDPAAAAAAILDGSNPDVRIVPVARNLIDLVEEVEGNNPSPLGRSMLALLEPIAGFQQP